MASSMGLGKRRGVTRKRRLGVGERIGRKRNRGDGRRRNKEVSRLHKAGYKPCKEERCKKKKGKVRNKKEIRKNEEVKTKRRDRQ